MIPQLDLLADTPRDCPAPDVDTAKAAAAAVRDRAVTLRFGVLTNVVEAGEVGLTSDEIQIVMATGGDTIRPRLWELENRKLVVKSDTKRQTRKGRAARAYVATEAGRYIVQAGHVELV